MIVEIYSFKKGERKDDVMLERLKNFDVSEGVVFIGKAQEKAHVPRTERRRNPDTGKKYPWLVTSTASTLGRIDPLLLGKSDPLIDQTSSS